MYENSFLGSREHLAGRIIDHWQRHIPQMYRDLKASGRLEEAAVQTAESTYRLCEILETKYDLSPLEAQSRAMKERALATYE